MFDIRKAFTPVKISPKIQKKCDLIRDLADYLDINLIQSRNLLEQLEAEVKEFKSVII